MSKIRTKINRCAGCGKEVVDKNGIPKELFFTFYRNPAYVLLAIRPENEVQFAKIHYESGLEMYCEKCYKEGDLKTILENINTGDSKDEKS